MNQGEIMERGGGEERGGKGIRRKHGALFHGESFTLLQHNVGRLVTLPGVTLSESGTGLGCAAQLGMDTCNGSGISWDPAYGLYDSWDTVSLKTAVYSQKLYRVPTSLSFVEADTKTLQDVWASLPRNGYLREDACFYTQLKAKAASTQGSALSPNELSRTYLGAADPAAAVFNRSEFPCSADLSTLKFTSDFAYRVMVASLINVLERAVGYEGMEISQKRPLPDIETTATELGLHQSNAYKRVKAKGLTERRTLLEAVKTAEAVFTSLTLKDFMMLQILAHSIDPNGVSSTW